jgi:hypothetical protein
MVSMNQIRELISNFLAGQKDADSFLDAFSALSVSINKHGEAAAVMLANQVESCLADVRAGFCSIDDLKKSLRELLAPPATAYYYVTVVGGFSQSVNQPAVVETAFPASASFSGTSTGVVFGSVSHLRA